MLSTAFKKNKNLPSKYVDLCNLFGAFFRIKYSKITHFRKNSRLKDIKKYKQVRKYWLK